jgi:hypothetical protein
MASATPKKVRNKRAGLKAGGHKNESPEESKRKEQG